MAVDAREVHGRIGECLVQQRFVGKAFVVPVVLVPAAAHEPLAVGVLGAEGFEPLHDFGVGVGGNKVGGVQFTA